MSRLRRLGVSGRFLLRSLTLRASQFSLALLAVTVGVSVAATAFDLRADLDRKMSRELRSYGPNLLLTPDTSLFPASLPGIEGPRHIEEGVVGALPALAGETAPVLASPVLYATGLAGEWAVTIAGIDADSARDLFPYWKIEGRWPSMTGPDTGGGTGKAARPDGECLVGSRLASAAGWRGGDRVQIDLPGATGLSLLVSGILSSGEAEEDQIFVPLPLLQGSTGRAGEVSLVAARVEGGTGRVEELARAAAEAHGVQARPLRQVVEAEGRLLDRLGLMMTLLGGLILALSALCVMTTLITVVVQREPGTGRSS
jgi:putative ABC transport system permease protein